MKIIYVLFFGFFLALKTQALPVLDQYRVLGSSGELVLIADHSDKKLFYYSIGSYSICNKGEGAMPEASLWAREFEKTPYVTVAFTLCPEIARGQGVTAERARNLISKLEKEEQARVVPLVSSIEVTQAGLWRGIFDLLKADIAYQCSTIPDTINVTCKIVGRGGRAYSEQSNDLFGARLLYDLFVKNAYAMNGYFSTQVRGLRHYGPDIDTLEEYTVAFDISFWAEPDFKRHPDSMKLEWIPE